MARCMPAGASGSVAFIFFVLHHEKIFHVPHHEKILSGRP